MGMIPQRIIEEVISANDIVEVAGKYIRMEKSGGNLKALCPFHNEKTPSFMLSPSKQIFHCFGCGAGGNVVKFLMQIENLTFIESLKRLARDKGITIDMDPLVMDREAKEAEKRDLLRQLLGRVNGVYRKQLIGNQQVCEYIKNRGLLSETIEKFGLGYASPEQAVARGSLFDDQQKVALADAGVLIRDNRGGFFEKFNGRITFPIRNHRGDVIGFGGRIIDGREAAKYLNSPDSSVYHKGENFYGIFECSSGIRKSGQVILVEGYMDLIAMFQAGFDNVVASLGTALTQYQAGMLKRMAGEIFVLYDSDEAGVRAAVRAGEILAREGVLAIVTRLPGAKDPDDFLKIHGPEKLQELMQRKHSYLEVKADWLNRSLDLDKVVDRRRIQMNLISVLAEARSFSEMLHADYLKLWSEQYRIRPDLLTVKEIRDNDAKKTLDARESVNKIEREILSSALQEEECLAALKELGPEAEDLFLEVRLKPIVRAMVSSGSSERWQDTLPEEVAAVYRQLCLDEAEQNGGKQWRSCLKHLKIRHLKQQRAMIFEKIKKGDEAGDPSLRKKWQELILKLKAEERDKFN